MIDKKDALALKHSIRNVEVAVKRHHKLLESMATKYRGQFDMNDGEMAALSGGTDKDQP